MQTVCFDASMMSNAYECASHTFLYGIIIVYRYVDNLCTPMYVRTYTIVVVSPC